MVRLRVKEIAAKKGMSMGKLSREAAFCGDLNDFTAMSETPCGIGLGQLVDQMIENFGCSGILWP